MESFRKLEGLVASWYKNVPHLPKSGQKWLAENVWWLVLVWIVLAALGIVSLLMTTFFAGAILAGVAGAEIGGLAFVIVTITMLFSIAMIVLGTIAVTALKTLQKKGWTLLFIIALVNVVAAVLTFLVNFNLLALVWDALLVAVGVYFLFEIRSYFDGAKAGRKKVTAKQKKNEE